MNRLLCFALLLASPVLLHAQVEAPERLPADYREAISKANKAFAEENYALADRYLTQAEKIIPENAVSQNLRGAIATNQKDYAKAQYYFERALENTPTFFPSSFNIAEILVLQRNYPEAREMFRKMLKNFPAQSELLEYKIFMTLLQEEKFAEAKAALEKFSFLGTTPAYNFANAAWDFKNGHPEKGQEWVESARRIFTPEQNSYFEETLADIGWLEKKTGSMTLTNSTDKSAPREAAPTDFPAQPINLK